MSKKLVLTNLQHLELGQFATYANIEERLTVCIL